MAPTFPDVEKELCVRISELQPELAPRLAQRLAQLPSSRLDAILTSEAAFMDALDGVLAQELSEQGVPSPRMYTTATPLMATVPLAQCPLQPAPPVANAFATPQYSAPRNVSPVYYCRQVTSSEAAFRVARSPRSPNQDSAAMLLVNRVAQVQPEKATRIVEKVFKLGPTAVHECVHSDLALQHCMEAALTAIDQEEQSQVTAEAAAEAPAPEPTQTPTPTPSPIPTPIPTPTPKVSVRCSSPRPTPMPPALCAGTNASAAASATATAAAAATAEEGLNPIPNAAAKQTTMPPAMPMQMQPRVVATPMPAAGPTPVPAPTVALPEQHSGARVRAVTPDARGPRTASPGPDFVRPMGYGGSVAVRQLSRVWGLDDFLTELSLTGYTTEATAWASTMGAAYLEELLENMEDFADALSLRPLERVRLQRYGADVVARLSTWRPRPVLMQAPTPKPIPNFSAAPQA